MLELWVEPTGKRKAKPRERSVSCRPPCARLGREVAVLAGNCRQRCQDRSMFVKKLCHQRTRQKCVTSASEPSQVSDMNQITGMDCFYSMLRTPVSCAFVCYSVRREMRDVLIYAAFEVLADARCCARGAEAHVPGLPRLTGHRSGSRHVHRTLFSGTKGLRAHGGRC